MAFNGLLSNVFSLDGAVIGVTTLNGLGGDISITSADSTIAVAASGDSVDLSIAAHSIIATQLQNAPVDLGNANITVDLSNSHAGKTTSLIVDGTITAGAGFVGNLTGNADTVTHGVYTTDTGTVTAKMLQNTPSDLGNTDITIDLSNSHAAHVTNLTTDGAITGGELHAANGFNSSGPQTYTTFTIVDGIVTDAS